MIPNKEKLITDICVTLRHDYGLDKPMNETHNSPFLSCGMTQSERMVLRMEAGQIVDNVIVPYLEQIAEAQKIKTELDCLKSLMYLNEESINQRVKELERKLISYGSTITNTRHSI